MRDLNSQRNREDLCYILGMAAALHSFVGKEDPKKDIAFKIYDGLFTLLYTDDDGKGAEKKRDY